MATDERNNPWKRTGDGRVYTEKLQGYINSALSHTRNEDFK
jgi:hypothetical protein